MNHMGKRFSRDLLRHQNSNVTRAVYRAHFSDKRREALVDLADITNNNNSVGARAVSASCTRRMIRTMVLSPAGLVTRTRSSASARKVRASAFDQRSCCQTATRLRASARNVVASSYSSWAQPCPPDERTQMSTIEDRLAEQGITLPEVAAPVAAYLPALQSGPYVHTSGQLPIVDGALVATFTLRESVRSDARREAKPAVDSSFWRRMAGGS